MCSASIEDSTKTGYNSALEDWFTFCDVFGRIPWEATQRNAAHYVWYLYKFTDISGGSASRRLTALGHYWTIHGQNWSRANFPLLAKMIKGFKKIKPPQLRPRNPWSFWHMNKAWQFINLNSYSGNVNAAILAIGHFYGGRVGEYASYSKKDWAKIVCPNDLQLIFNGTRLVSIIIDFKWHKTNKEGIYAGKVEAVCACDTGICPIHIIHRYLQLRTRIWGNSWDNFPLLLTNKGKPVRAAHVNNLIKTLALKLKLDPALYASHSLRSGRATDLARAFKPSWFIKKWGRWRSDCWQDFYAKLDFSDIAKLSKLSLYQLGLSGNSLTFRELAH